MMRTVVMAAASLAFLTTLISATTAAERRAVS